MTKVTGTSTPTPRKRAASRPAKPVAQADAEEKVERVLLATVSGIECWAPKQEDSFDEALTYIGNLLRMKKSTAEVVLVQSLIGATTFFELIDKKMGKDEWRELANAASRHAFGALDEEAAQGN